MKMSMFSVQDSKAGMFLPPFPAPNAGVAIRQFTDAIANENSVLSKHPEDYALYELGTFDDVSGQSENLKTPKMIGTANQYVVVR